MVEFVLQKDQCSIQDALEILDLLRTGVVNETLDENNETIYIEGYIYDYCSSEQDGYNPLLMNLPKAVLDTLPLNGGDFEDGEVDKDPSLAEQMPEKKKDFWEQVQDFVMKIFYVLAEIFITTYGLAVAIKDGDLEAIGSVLSKLEGLATSV